MPISSPEISSDFTTINTIPVTIIMATITGSLSHGIHLIARITILRLFTYRIAGPNIGGRECVILGIGVGTTMSQ